MKCPLTPEFVPPHFYELFAAFRFSYFNQIYLYEVSRLGTLDILIVGPFWYLLSILALKCYFYDANTCQICARCLVMVFLAIQT